MKCPKCASTNVLELDNLHTLWGCGYCGHQGDGSEFDPAIRLIEQVAMMMGDESARPMLETYIWECIQQESFAVDIEPAEVLDMFLADCCKFLDVFVQS